MCDRMGINVWEVVCQMASKKNAARGFTEDMPAIIRFLGYDPLPAAKTLGEQLIRRRTSLGFSQKQAARMLAVDPTTLARWERGEREPTREFLGRVERFLDADAASLSARRAG